MTSRAERSPARAVLPRLPGWVTVLGVVLVLGELTGGAVLLAGGPSSLAALSGETRTVVLKVDGACGSDDATYRTPTGDGQFDITVGRSPEGLTECMSHGSPTTPTLTKTVAVPAGGTVTISIFNGTGDPDLPLTCSITVNGSALDQVQAGDGKRATCRARIP